MNVPSNIDLTLKRDFNRDERDIVSIKIPLETRDESYKRYNEYRDDFTFTSTSSLNSTYDDFFTIRSIISSTRSPLDINPWNSLTRKVEERVCWRELYKDPSIYEQSYTVEEWKERIRNFNFPLGSKLDRLRTHYELLRKAERNLEGACDCCGSRINYNNCLTYHHGLCQRCNYYFYNHIDSIRL